MFNPRFFCVARHLPLVFFLLAPSLFSHVTLLSPNGGQTYAPGQTVSVSWTPSPGHNTVFWHLHYSTSGPSGPWTPIALNLPPTNIITGQVSFFSWVLPNINSTNVFIRVTQDNTDTDYDDVNNSSFAVVNRLTVDGPTVSATQPTPKTLTLDAGVALAFEVYWIFGSLSGIEPGVTDGTSILPLNQDFYFDLTLTSPNTPPLLNSASGLDHLGRGQASFELPQGLPPTLAGLQIYHAGVVVTGTGVGLITNAVSLTLTP